MRLTSLILRIAMAYLLGLAILSQDAFAGRVRELPDFRQDAPALTLNHYVLGNTCLSLPTSGLDLQCNPAFLAQEEKRQLRLNLTGNDKVRNVYDYRSKLNDNNVIGVVDQALSDREPVIAKAAASIWYQHDWFAIGYVPMRAGFASVVKNPAYPEIDLHVFNESEIFAKAGFFLESDPQFLFGLQARYVDRDYFRGDFELLDAVSDGSILHIDNQKILFLEPGIAYVVDPHWGSTLSATVTQLPVYRKGVTDEVRPVIDLGASLAPPFAKGKWKTSTHYSQRSDVPDLLDSFLWGSSYDFGPLAASLMLGRSVFAAGVSGHIDSLVLGAGYKTEEVAPDQWYSSRTSSILFELGLVF